MGRPVILSNGSMLVGLSEQGLVHDFYYPYVGLDNLDNARSLHHKIGVWIDGVFSWIDNDDWQRIIDFNSDALVSNINVKNSNLQLELRFKDFVDVDNNALVRRITVINLADHDRDIRIFMHQVFQISRAGRADTGLYIPEENYILDYKGRCCLLITGQWENGGSFDQYAVGNYGIEGKEGTYKDAEDGELSNNPVEHGGIDTVVRFKSTVVAGGTANLDYWIIAAASQNDAEVINSTYKKQGINERLQATQQFWHNWLGTAANGLHTIDKKYLSMTKKSLMVIKAHIDHRGAVLASADSSIFNYGRDYYCYCWPRDAAFALWPMIRLGYTEEPMAFFEFCRDVLHPGGYLSHKYQPDRAIGSTWHPQVHNNRKELAIQEDETAVVLYMLGEFLECGGDEEFVRNLYGTLVQPMANFMASFIDEDTNLPHASYDLWEQKFLTTTYTTMITEVSLRVGARLAEKFEYPDDATKWNKAADRIAGSLDAFYDANLKTYIKGFLREEDGSLTYDTTVDSSNLYGLFMFGERKADFDRLNEAMAVAEARLSDVTPSGGVIRYENDSYFLAHPEHKGNPWYVCTYWQAQYYIRRGDHVKAQKIIDWTLGKATNSGMFGEQLDSQSAFQTGVSPLVWSHAEFLNTVLDLVPEE